MRNGGAASGESEAWTGVHTRIALAFSGGIGPFGFALGVKGYDLLTQPP